MNIQYKDLFLILSRLSKIFRIVGGEVSLRQRRIMEYVGGADLLFQQRRRCLFISLAVLTAGCATTTTSKVYQHMALAGVAGAAYGLSKDEYKTTQGLMYGSLGAAIAAATTLYFENPDKEEIKLRDEVKSLKAQLDKINEPKLVSQMPATFGARIPEKYRSMVQPGEWKIFETDEWEEDGENRLKHSDRVMELIPPSLVPGAGR